MPAGAVEVWRRQLSSYLGENGVPKLGASMLYSSRGEPQAVYRVIVGLRTCMATCSLRYRQARSQQLG